MHPRSRGWRADDSVSRATVPRRRIYHPSHREVGYMAPRSMIPSEEDEQRAVVQWLQWHQILAIHVPNGGQRSRIEAAIMNGLGVRPGVPDLLVFDRPPGNRDALGAAIELKRRKGGKVSDSQWLWLAQLEARGWLTAVCEGAEAAIAQLEAWGYGKRKEARAECSR